MEKDNFKNKFFEILSNEKIKNKRVFSSGINKKQLKKESLFYDVRLKKFANEEDFKSIILSIDNHIKEMYKYIEILKNVQEDYKDTEEIRKEENKLDLLELRIDDAKKMKEEYRDEELKNILRELDLMEHLDELKIELINSYERGADLFDIKKLEEEIEHVENILNNNFKG